MAKYRACMIGCGSMGMHQGLVDAIKRGGEPFTSGDDMRKVLEIAIALRESARRDNAKVRLPIADRSLKIIPKPGRWLGKKPIEVEATKA